ncbi:hypothetical protein EIP91_008920 [Steccherinum ochraceum]|uniref:NIPA-like protein 3 n=1 Tax=Steccherinum ochraceum TaxID=92696 RepID=A0A4R0RYX1_9APHY|nr:hypothetical protein EIP91_008920 [Steccherinum ochraceum]
MNGHLSFTSAVKFMSSDAPSTVSIPIGITIGLLASFIQSLGLTIQRKSHVLNQALPEDQQRVEHRRPLWLLGFAIFISSNLFGSLVQIASLPVVILAPLGAVSLLWNAFFARMLLGDAFSVWMVLGTILIAGGAVLIAVFGVVPEPTHSLEDLLILFGRPAFVVYFSLLGVFVVACLITTHVLEYSYSRRASLPATTPPLSPLLAPNTAPTVLTTAANPTTTMDPTASERTPLIDRKTSRPSSPSDGGSYTFPSTWSERMPTLLAMSYASFSGIISGMCLLFAKSGVELLVLTIAGDNQFWRWQAWVLVVGLVICALLQLWYMHKGLVLANPTLICPLAFCFYNLSSIINGLVYFDQFSLLSTVHLCLVLVGMVILLAGVWIVSLPPSGGYGVDITRWDEQHAAARGDEEAVEVYEDEPLPMVPPRTSYTEPSTPTVESPPDEDGTTGLGIITLDGNSGRYGTLHNQPSPTKVSPHAHARQRRTGKDIREPSAAMDVFKTDRPGGDGRSASGGKAARRGQISIHGDRG